MKQCLKCHKEYPDNVKFCPQCGVPVREMGEETDPLVGRVLGGRYLVEERVGAGGFGTVYKVRDQRFSNAYKALKVIHPRHAHDRIAMERFRQEANLLFDLGKRSASIVQFYDFDEDEQEKLFYFAMEWVDGIPLTQLLVRQGQLTPQRAVRLIRQVCEPLRVAHRRLVIHRDLKPDNLMLVQEDEEEMVKILDFGIAKALAEEWGEKRFTESVLGMPGTAGYAAPEQIEGRTTEIGPPTDLFAVGVIFYTLVTGRDPWFGKRVNDPLTRREEMVDLPSRVLEGRCIPPRQWNPELPQELEAIILKLLEREPARRFQSAAELDQTLAALEKRWTAPAPAPSIPTTEERRELRPPPLPRRPWYQDWRLYAGALVAVLIVVAVLLWPRLRPPPPPAPTVSLEADSTTITKGESATLTWETTDASSVEFQPSLGGVELSGSQNVKPEETTTYTLIATGEGGRTEQSVQVEVRPRPPTPTPTPTPPPSRPEVSNLRVTVNSNASRSGQQGVEVRASFLIQGQQSTATCAVAYFTDRLGNPLRDQNGAYRDPNGNVAVLRDFTPRTDSDRPDLALFLPLDELHLREGAHQLQAHVTIWPKACRARADNALGFSGRQSFQVEVRPAISSVTASGQGVTMEIRVDANAFEGGVGGVRVHFDLDIQGQGGNKSCAAVYFYDENRQFLKDKNENLPYRDTNKNIAVFRDFAPSSDSERIRDLALFIPTEELHLGRGQHRVYALASIWGSPCTIKTTELAATPFVPFTVSVR